MATFECEKVSGSILSAVLKKDDIYVRVRAPSYVPDTQGENKTRKVRILHYMSGGHKMYFYDQNLRLIRDRQHLLEATAITIVNHLRSGVDPIEGVLRYSHDACFVFANDDSVFTSFSIDGVHIRHECHLWQLVVDSGICTLYIK